VTLPQGMYTQQACSRPSDNDVTRQAEINEHGLLSSWLCRAAAIQPPHSNNRMPHVDIAVHRSLRPTVRGGGCIGRAASVYRERIREMQICRAFKTPTMLLHFLLRVNSQQTAADRHRCSIGLSIGDTDTGPIPLVSARYRYQVLVSV